MPFSTPFEIGSCGSKAPTLATTSMMCGSASRSTTKPVRRSPNRTSFISFSCCEGESKRSVAFARNEKLRFLLLNWKDGSSFGGSRYDDKIQSAGRLVVHPLITEVSLPVKSATRYSPIFDK